MTHKEITVATTGELEDGEMSQVSAGGTDILLARVEGEYYAVGAHCPHYGAPLAEGALCGERIEAEAVTSAPRTRLAESFDAELRGIPTPVSVHRLMTLETNWSWGSRQAPKKMFPSSSPITV